MPKILKVSTPGSPGYVAMLAKKQSKTKMKKNKKKKKELKEKEKERSKLKKGVGRPPVKKRTPRKVISAKYTKDDLDYAISLVRERGLPIATAARKARVPRITLHDRVKGIHKSGQVGRPKELSQDEEESLVESCVLMGSYNFPLTKRHLRDMVKNSLDRKDRSTRFPNNRPGLKWSRHFVKRHSDRIVVRRASNIRRSRAAVSPDDIRAYFANLAVELEGIPPTHIFNCDETNLADNPSAEKCIFVKGVKYPEMGSVHFYHKISSLKYSRVDMVGTRYLVFRVGTPTLYW
jgi:hypothetical protein